MKIDITKPFEVELEKFTFGSTKDSINPYTTGKILRKKCESSGFVVVQCADFEANMLVWFSRRHNFLDKYIKVKIGEYKTHSKTESYISQMLAMFKPEEAEKLLFICRICSYLGDPSFPDFIVKKENYLGLRYAYVGDEMLRDRIAFILLSNGILNIEIKFCCLDFIDFMHPEKLSVDLAKNMENLLKTLSKRVNIGNSTEDTNIDLLLFKKWADDKSIDTEDINKSYQNFMSRVSAETPLKKLLSKLQSVDNRRLLEGKTRPEQLAVLRNALGINMMEANDLLNLHGITADQ